MPGSPSRPGRALAALAAGIAFLYTLMALVGVLTPRLGLDLEGGTSITLTARSEGGKVTSEAMDQAVGIIRQRVDGLGVAESEVTTEGSDNIVISVPGKNERGIVRLVGQTAKLRFRPVLTQGQPGPVPTATPAQPSKEVTAALQQRYDRLDCTQPASRQGAVDDKPADPLVACDRDGKSKFILGPTVVEGTEVTNAVATLDQTTQTRWLVDLGFSGTGTRQFGDATTKAVAAPPPQNQIAIVLDGVVVSAPVINEPITGGKAQITGDFTQKEARDLANVLKYGALPLAFTQSEVTSISPTLGTDQLQAGLLAGAIGLALVVGYLMLYYRGLGIVAVASLLVAGTITYAAVVLLGWRIGFTLTLAGVAGLIVAIGITADSFVVYFERLRDEVREGRTLRVAAEAGWVRARRTIISADVVSFLAAAVLYLLSIGSVRGFAFTLGLTTLVDILVVFAFTKPLVTLLARRPFFRDGHRFSGLDANRLGGGVPVPTTPQPVGHGRSDAHRR